MSDLGKSVSVTLPGGRIEHRILCWPMSLCRSDSHVHSAKNAGEVRRVENAVEGSTAAATAPRAELSEVRVINDDVEVRSHRLPFDGVPAPSYCILARRSRPTGTWSGPGSGVGGGTGAAAAASQESPCKWKEFGAEERSGRSYWCEGANHTSPQWFMPEELVPQCQNISESINGTQASNVCKRTRHELSSRQNGVPYWHNITTNHLEWDKPGDIFNGPFSTD